MKTICLLFSCLLLATSVTFISLEAKSLNEVKRTNQSKITSFPLKINQFYNEIVDDQLAIEKLNQQRPKIYVYTDFGGGKNLGKPVVDLQTSGELTSAAWKATLQQKLYINNSAHPLSPLQAAVSLALTFPYEEKNVQHSEPEKIQIHTVVVHVVDPGVGNEGDFHQPQPRSIVLRKDGVLFIGPDNGALTFVCPDKSISKILKINADRLNLLSGVDVNAGGTFHGRDLFCEAAFRSLPGQFL